MNYIKIFLLLIIQSAVGQSLKPSDELWKQIESKNKVFADAFISGNSKTLTKYYTDNAVLFPEHSKMRKSKISIEDYYKQWLTHAKVNSFSKTILEIQDLGDYILEIGTYKQVFTKTDKKPYEYDGKYMIIWGKQPRHEEGSYITAELWGANSQFNDENLPQIDDTDVNPYKDSTLNNGLAKEVVNRNAIIRQLVMERKGEEHSRLFLPDAIYMTYYTPILSGIDAIKGYFIEHEKPGDVVINALTFETNDVYKTNSHIIIEYASYSVGYTYKTDKGSINGKSINIWKRNKNGQLMLYRQAVNHD